MSQNKTKNLRHRCACVRCRHRTRCRATEGFGGASRKCDFPGLEAGRAGLCLSQGSERLKADAVLQWVFGQQQQRGRKKKKKEKPTKKNKQNLFRETITHGSVPLPCVFQITTQSYKATRQEKKGKVPNKPAANQPQRVWENYTHLQGPHQLFC